MGPSIVLSHFFVNTLLFYYLFGEINPLLEPVSLCLCLVPYRSVFIFLIGLCLVLLMEALFDVQPCIIKLNYT